MAVNENSTDDGVITIDGIDYNIEALSDAAKAQILNIKFVDARTQQLNNEWAVADTARIGYENALKKELDKTGGE